MTDVVVELVHLQVVSSLRKPDNYYVGLPIVVFIPIHQELHIQRGVFGHHFRFPTRLHHSAFIRFTSVTYRQFINCSFETAHFHEYEFLNHGRICQVNFLDARVNLLFWRGTFVEKAIETMKSHPSFLFIYNTIAISVKGFVVLSGSLFLRLGQQFHQVFLFLESYLRR